MNWENITGDTSRLRVPGGWLYQVYISQYAENLMQVTFVPDPENRLSTGVPELLAALKSILTISSYSEHASEAHKVIASTARAAIAKVEGKT